jgi:Family of unknown function (DUF6533)
MYLIVFDLWVLMQWPIKTRCAYGLYKKLRHSHHLQLIDPLFVSRPPLRVDVLAKSASFSRNSQLPICYWSVQQNSTVFFCIMTTIIAAGFVILLYDHLLTIADEIQYIWKTPRSIKKGTFIFNRYLVLCVSHVGLSYLPTCSFGYRSRLPTYTVRLSWPWYGCTTKDKLKSAASMVFRPHADSRSKSVIFGNLWIKQHVRCRCQSFFSLTCSIGVISLILSNFLILHFVLELWKGDKVRLMLI